MNAQSSQHPRRNANNVNISVIGDSDGGSFVENCSNVVASMMTGDSVVLVGDVGVLVHPTSIAITIKLILRRNMDIPVSKTVSFWSDNFLQVRALVNHYTCELITLCCGTTSV